MTGKKISIGSRPTAKSASASPDAWVENRNSEPAAEPTKRLTLDIPASLHVRIKSVCAARGTKMIEEITALLSEKFSA